MATPTPAAGAQSPSATNPYTITPAPYATEGQKSCFICLQNEQETPDATWVSACPCSLEAHEACMLRWVAEMEVSQTSNRSSRNKSGGFNCPACKAPIIVDEPYDGVIAIRNRLSRLYNQSSPFILMAIVGGSSIAGSAAYGSLVSMLVVGPDTFRKWLGPFPAAFYQGLKLSLVGPGLVIVRFLASLGNVLIVPIGAVSGAILLAHDEFLTWPPSLEWAMSLFPVVNFTYNLAYYEIFGSFERRLNRALRGRPMTDELNDQALPAAPAGNNNNNGQQQEEEGIWDSVLNLGRAVIGLFNDEDEEGNGEGGNGGQGGRAGGDAELVVELELNLPALGGDGDGNAQNEEADLAEEFHQLLDDAPAQLAAPAAAAAEPAQAQAQQAQQQQQAVQNQPRRNDMYEPSYFGSIFSSIVTSLLFPAISFGMGEAIRFVAPKSWRGRPGLLQERWGRSLAGGCLFVVLKDAFALWIKYRRVQVKLNRKVRNVEKKRGTN